MATLIARILTDKEARNASTLAAIIAASANVGQPWADE
jgi:hypothetical protein